MGYKFDLFGESTILQCMKEVITNCVAKIRQENNITQQDLADRLNVSRQTIIAIERGNYTPSVLLSLKISKYFNKKLEDVFNIKYEK